MQHGACRAGFTGTSSDGRERRFELDLQLHAAKVLTPQLADPSNPRCCPLCISQYGHMLTLASLEPALAVLLEHEHGFFGACANAVAAPRTTDDLQHLRRLLESNVLSCSTQYWHPCLPPRSGDVLCLFVSGVYKCLEAPFHRGRRPLKPGSTFSKPRKGVWPLSLGDLLPYGLEESIAAHVFWWNTCLTPSIYPFLIMILDIARPSVLPHLIAGRQRTMLMDTVLKLLNSPSTASSTGQSDVSSFSTWTPRQRSTAPTIAAELINTLMTGHDSRTGEFARFSAGYELALFEAISGIFNDNDAREALNHLNRMLLMTTALGIHARLELPETTLPAELVAFRAYLHPPGVLEQQSATGARMTQMLVINRRNLRTCAGPGCTTVAATTNRAEAAKLQACSRCKFFRYCGRDCQQADWKGGSGHVAHKKLCPVLCRLSDGGALDGDRSFEDYSDVYDRVGVTKDELDILVQWARTSKLIPEAMTTRFLKNEPV
ncbi:hypothetical protein AURDEDRAFT_116362 [Auricularia subglabra TFB-10046 SS5]|nr:hypothetical protein AURDEDRAFT_116362 [Auricularia subglabra TFB-10046 SS5]